MYRTCRDNIYWPILSDNIRLLSDPSPEYPKFSETRRTALTTLRDQVQGHTLLTTSDKLIMDGLEFYGLVSPLATPLRPMWKKPVNTSSI